MAGDVSRFTTEAARLNQRVDSCFIRIIGGPLTSTLRIALETSLTTEVRGIYSSNETAAIAVTDENDVATLLPDVMVKIVGERGQVNGMGEPGIIMVRTPRMSSGYPWDEPLTAQHFVSGWFRTSGIGVMPEPDKRSSEA